MAAFFSGTDNNTLNKIGETMNHCVSLIVNNAGQYVARMTRIVDESYNVNAKGSYNTFNSETRDIHYEFTANNKKSLEYIDAEIVVSDPDELSEDEIEFLENRIDGICKAKEEKRRQGNDRFTVYDPFEDFDNYYSYGYGYSRMFNDGIKNISKSKEKDFKKFVYSVITGDMFPLNSVVKGSIESVMTDALKIYGVKRRSINSMIEEDNGLEEYVEAVINYYDSMKNVAECIDMIKYAVSVFEEYAAQNKWIEQLYNIFIMYGE